MHARTTIRDRITTLLTGLATTGSSVFQSRVYALQTSDLPALSIYSLAEEMIEQTMDDHQIRQLTIGIDIHVKATASYDTIVDNITAEIEVALGADRTLGISCHDSSFNSFIVEFDKEAEQPQGTATLEWLVAYEILSTNPSTIL